MLSLATMGYIWNSLAIFGYLGLYWAISGYLWQSLAIFGYLSLYIYQVTSIRVQVEAGEGKLLLFKTFFLAGTSYRGARTPRNQSGRDFIVNSLIQRGMVFIVKIPLK